MSPTLQPFLPIVLAIGVILAPIPRSLWALDANHIVATARPGCLRDLAGITVEEQGRISHLLTRPLALRRGDDEIPTTPWYELLATDSGTKIAAIWVGQHLDELPVNTVRPVGRGHVIYVGAWISDDLLRYLLPLLSALTDLKPLPGAIEGLHVVCRHGADRTFWLLFNTSSGSLTATGQVPGHDLLIGLRQDGTLNLERLGCAIILSDGYDPA